MSRDSKRIIIPAINSLWNTKLINKKFLTYFIVAILSGYTLSYISDVFFNSFYLFMLICVLVGCPVFIISLRKRQRKLQEQKYGYQPYEKPFFGLGYRTYIKTRSENDMNPSVTLENLTKHPNKLQRRVIMQQSMNCSVCGDDIKTGQFIEKHIVFRVSGIPIYNICVKTVPYCEAHAVDSKPDDYDTITI